MSQAFANIITAQQRIDTTTLINSRLIPTSCVQVFCGGTLRVLWPKQIQIVMRTCRFLPKGGRTEVHLGFSLWARSAEGSCACLVCVWRGVGIGGRGMAAWVVSGSRDRNQTQQAIGQRLGVEPCTRWGGGVAEWVGPRRGDGRPAALIFETVGWVGPEAGVVIASQSGGATPKEGADEERWGSGRHRKYTRPEIGIQSDFLEGVGHPYPK